MPTIQNQIFRRIAMLSVALLLVQDADAVELLTNPGFEAGTSGWIGRSCSIAAETTEVNSGGGAVRVYGRNKEWDSVRQDITTVLLANGPGDYTVKASIRAEAGFSGTAKIKLIINSMVQNTPSSVSDTGWTDISMVRNISWTGTLVEAYFEIPHDTPSASYYVDDCSLEPVGPNQSPIFFSDPMEEKNGAQDTAYVATLIDDAYDSDGDSLTFTNLSGPTWLTVAPDGTLSGTPTSGDVGLNTFSVQCSDGGGTNALTALHINVLPPPTPLTLPYTDSFETHTRGAPLQPSIGWDAPASDAPTIIAHVSNYPPTNYPFAVPHDQVLDLYGATQPVFEQPAVSAQTLFDTLLQPTFRTDPAPPSTDTDTQAAFFVNDDGYLVVRHKVYGNNFTTATEVWSTLSHTPLTAGQWVRLTMLADYQSDTLRDHSFYSISLDNAPLSHPLAYSTRSPTNEASDTNGPWFLCANSGPGTAPLSFSGLGVDGITRLDDMAVSDPVQRTSRGTPFAWIDTFYPPGNYEALDTDDSDGDGMTTWEEYRAGTDPAQNDSVLAGELQILPNGDHQILWPSSLLGALTPYSLHRTTNLVDELSWQEIAGPISRDLSGTNEWFDTSPPASPSVFYRIEVPGP